MGKEEKGFWISLIDKILLSFFFIVVVILLLISIILRNFMEVFKCFRLSSQCSKPLFGTFCNFIPVYKQFEFLVKPLW